MFMGSNTSDVAAPVHESVYTTISAQVFQVKAHVLATNQIPGKILGEFKSQITISAYFRKTCHSLLKDSAEDNR